MNETELAKLIEQELATPHLMVQVTQETTYLVITLNRSPDWMPNYIALEDQVSEFLQSWQAELPQVQVLFFYGRVWGEIDPEWQSEVAFTSTELTSIDFSDPIEFPQVQERALIESASTVSDAVSPDLAAKPVTNQPESIEAEPEITQSSESIPSEHQAQKEFNLADYCFIRNTSLLKGKLTSPPSKVAEAIQQFHDFEEVDRRQLLPFLEIFFRNPQHADISAFPEHLQHWLANIQQFDERALKSITIWLSRYCANPEVTMPEIEAVLGISSVEAPASAEAQSNIGPTISATAASPVSEQAEQTVKVAQHYQSKPVPKRVNQDEATLQKAANAGHSSAAKLTNLSPKQQLLAMAIAGLVMTAIIITLGVLMNQPVKREKPLNALLSIVS